MIKKWKTKKSTEVFKTGWFSIRKDDCLRGDGKRIKDFYTIISPNGAMVVPVTDFREVIMVNQYRQSIKKFSLECPAGFMDKGESFLKTAKRELLEETGYSFKKIKKLGEFYSYSSKLTTKVGIFLATGCRKEGSQKLDGGENLDVEVVPFDRINKLIESGRIDSMDSVLALKLAVKNI